MRRSQPGWPPRCRTLTISWRATVSPRWSDWRPSSPASAPRGRIRWSGGSTAVREILERLQAWQAGGTGYALATVVGVHGSAPRDPGAAMAVSADGEVVGSVSGGCVEGAVYESAREVLETGEAVLETYGISDEDAFSVGLTCGGVLDVLVQPVRAPELPAGGSWPDVLASVGPGEPVAVATVVSGPAQVGATLAVWPTSSSGSRVAGSL